MSTVSAPTLQSLSARLRGTMITPTDAGYDSARRVWNGIHDRYPAAVVRALGVVDVVEVVHHTRETGLELAVRGGGHSAAGHSTSDGGIVLDLSRMKGVWVDPGRRLAHVQAGALWGDVDRETQAHGLAVPGGQISHTGVAGLTLGGGVGWLSRQHGLTVDNLVSVDVVTADGRIVTASEAQHPDLFWGLRGGSGNFGVAVSFTFRLHPVGPIVLGGPLVYALDDAADALRNAREAMAAAPDEVSLWLSFTHVPQHEPFPRERWGETVLAVVPFCTDLVRGPELLAPLTAHGAPLANLHGPIPYTVLQSVLDDVDPHGNRYWERGDYLVGLEDDVVDAFVAAARSMTSPLHEILVFPLGGAIARVDSEATAFPSRDARWASWIVGQWTDPDEDEIHRAWVRETSQSVAHRTTGGVYVNALGNDVTTARRAAAYGGERRLARLRELKRVWDPGNLFRLNANIEPAEPSS